MFNQQPRRAPGSMPTPGPIQAQCDIQAKEKLTTYIYEFLVHSGYQKAADALKEDGLTNYPNAIYKPSECGPGFLYNWWTVFWDLYSADRRDPNSEPSLEGKQYYDSFVSVAGQFPPSHMMNGMPGMFPPGAMMPGPDGMMPAGFARFPGGRPGPGPGGMPAAYMFGHGDPRAAAAMAAQQRMAPNAMRMPTSSFGPPGPGPGMRPTPGASQGMNFRGGFIDSPSQAFPPGAMMPNGMGSHAMSSPGMPPGDGSYMMGSMPSSSTAMPFGMGDTSVSIGNGVPPSSMCENGGVGNPNQQQQQQMMMMNGEELKQSPVSTPRGVNGGTPAPGSVQSGQPSSGTPAAAPHMEEKTSSESKPEDEISKIKQGLMDDFTPKEESAESMY